jgi:hypothetical protein
MMEGANRASGEDRAPDDLTVDPLPRLLDLNGAARYLGVSYWTVREYVFGGVLASVKLPCPRSKDGRPLRRILIDRRDLDALIEANREVEL